MFFSPDEDDVVAQSDAGVRACSGAVLGGGRLGRNTVRRGTGGCAAVRVRGQRVLLQYVDYYITY